MTHILRLLSTCAVAFYTKPGQNNTLKYDTESFVPVVILHGMVGLLSSFIISLIGRTLKKICRIH